MSERLEEVAEIVMGQSPPSTSYNLDGIGLPFFQGAGEFGDIYPITRLYSRTGSKRARSGDILLSVRAPVGPVNIARHDCIIGRGLAAIRARPKIRSNYLFYYLRFSEGRFKEAGKGSTVDSIRREDLEQFEVTRPDDEAQQRIAKLLEDADRIRLRRDYITSLRTGFLIQVFREMFREQLSHPRRLGDVCEITGGGTPSRSVAEYFTGSIPWLTPKDVKDWYISDSEEHITHEALANSSAKLVDANSVIVVVKSKVLANRVPVAISRVPLCHGQDVKSIQVSEGMDPNVIAYAIKNSEQALVRSARGANTEGLTLEMLERVPIPSLDISSRDDKESFRRFSAAVKAFDKLVMRQAEASRLSDSFARAVLFSEFRIRIPSQTGKVVQSLQ